MSNIATNIVFTKLDAPVPAYVEQVLTWKKIQNHPNFGHNPYASNIYALSHSHLLQCSSMFEKLFSGKMTDAQLTHFLERVAGELGKQTFCKRHILMVSDHYQCRWEGERPMTVGFIVSKKKLNHWLIQNQNRFLKFRGNETTSFVPPRTDQFPKE